MHKRKCGCVYADSKDTAVRKGYEVGGYVKEFCETHKRKPKAEWKRGDPMPMTVEEFHRMGDLYEQEMLRLILELANMKSALNDLRNKMKYGKVKGTPRATHSLPVINTTLTTDTIVEQARLLRRARSDFREGSISDIQWLIQREAVLYPDKPLKEKTLPEALNEGIEQGWVEPLKEKTDE